VTELHFDKVNLLYKVTEFYWDKYFKICPNLSSRTYGSLWQGFSGTSHLRNSLSAVNPDKPFYKTEWQSFVGTSHFYLL